MKSDQFIEYIDTNNKDIVIREMNKSMQDLYDRILNTLKHYDILSSSEYEYLINYIEQLENSIDMYASVLETTEKEKMREEQIHILLQQRIDKVIEILICLQDECFCDICYELLESPINILKGESNNE